MSEKVLGDIGGDIPEDNRSAPLPEGETHGNAPVKSTTIFREYHSREPGKKGQTMLVARTANLHNTKDEPIAIDAMMFHMALSAGAKDGDEIEILLRRKGPSKFPLIRWVIDEVRGLHAIKLVPKKLITPGLSTENNSDSAQG